MYCRPRGWREIPPRCPIFSRAVRALIDRYQKNGVKEVSHIFYDGARHEPLNDFCCDQMHTDALKWLDAHLI
jgi:alpha-beta hydrolase superfamily lysophospholipase